MLNHEVVKEMFADVEITDSNGAFVVANNLTYIFSGTHKDITVSDMKGNAVCVYVVNEQVKARVFAENVSKKLDKASDVLIDKINKFYN